MYHVYMQYDLYFPKHIATVSLYCNKYEINIISSYVFHLTVRVALFIFYLHIVQINSSEISIEKNTYFQ